MIIQLVRSFLRRSLIVFAFSRAPSEVEQRVGGGGRRRRHSQNQVMSNSASAATETAVADF